MPPPPKLVTVKGHVIADVRHLTGYLRDGFGGYYKDFVFGIESGNGNRTVPVIVTYKFFYRTEKGLPDSFFDASKRYELHVERESYCDKTVQDLSYEKNINYETGKPLPSAYILKLLDTAAKDILKPELTLPCYMLRSGKYKILDSHKKLKY